MTVPEALAALQEMVDAGVTEGFLAIEVPAEDPVTDMVMGGNVATVTGFELVDDWCLIRYEE